MDDTKTLEALERQIWGDPEFNSHLVRTCHQLRKIPLKDLTPENLRMLIGQQIGLTYLMPLALDLLEQHLLVSGATEDGDLLCAVAKVGSEFWDAHPDLKYRAFELTQTIESALTALHLAKSRFADSLSW